MDIAGLLFLYGLRHGFDWDHIAAITSIAGASENRKVSFLSSFLYILGHSCVIIILGSLAILFGVLLPDWVDHFMEPLVGVTLILLGIWILISYLRHKNNANFVSRGHILITAIQKVRIFFSRKDVVKEEEKLTYTSPFLVGCIHGIGAETPTQMLLFLTVGNVDGKSSGLLLLLLFVAGLVLSNTLISLFSVFGYSGIKNQKALFAGIILLSAALSIGIGISILLGKGDMIPAIFAG